MKLTNVRELLETTKIDEANQKLTDGWVLIETFHSEGVIKFVLGLISE